MTIGLSYVKPVTIRSIRIRLDSTSLALLLIWLNSVEIISLVATLAAFIFIGVTFAMEWTEGTVKAVLTTVSTLLFLILGFHLLPGFERVGVFDNVAVKANSTLYSLKFSADKYLAGLVFFLFVRQTVSTRLNASLLFKIFLTSILNIVVVLGLGLLTGIIEWQSWGQIDWHFIIIFLIWQLAFVCLTEEMFFRGFIQNKLYGVFASRSENQKIYLYMPVIVSASLFGLVHLGGGWLYAVLAGLAGIGYSLVYHFSRRVEAAIIAHSLLNLIHLMFFTYPFSANFIAQ